jgi:hypothetical protein
MRALIKTNWPSFVMKKLSNLYKQLCQYKHDIRLRSIDNKEQFNQYISKYQPDNFLFYKNISSKKRLEFHALLDVLSINLNGMKFLDIGPGFGDTLDIAQEQGAEAIDFVEIDPFFYHYNRLKGFARGYKISMWNALHKLTPGYYDFIYIRGTFSVDLLMESKTGWRRLSYVLDQLERLSSKKGKIAICPHWRNDKLKRNTEDVYNNKFTQRMIEAGYSILPKIDDHNVEPTYPITFLRKFTYTN